MLPTFPGVVLRPKNVRDILKSRRLSLTNKFARAYLLVHDCPMLFNHNVSYAQAIHMRGGSEALRALMHPASPHLAAISLDSTVTWAGTLIEVSSLRAPENFRVTIRV